MSISVILWLILGLVLTMLEIFIPTFMLLWAGVGALLTAFLSWVFATDRLDLQLMFWAGFSSFLTIVWFRFINPRIKTRTQTLHTGEAVLGKEGIVSAYDPIQKSGRMQFSFPVLGDREWMIMSEDPVSLGDKVRVMEIIGNRLKVERI